MELQELIINKYIYVFYVVNKKQQERKKKRKKEKERKQERKEKRRKASDFEIKTSRHTNILHTKRKYSNYKRIPESMPVI